MPQILFKDLIIWKQSVISIANIELSGSITLIIVKFNSAIQSAQDTLEASRMALLKQYANTDVDGNLIEDAKKKAIFKSQESEIKYREEYNKLLNESSCVDIPKIPGVTDSYLSSIEAITPGQMSVLLNFKVD